MKNKVSPSKTLIINKVKEKNKEGNFHVRKNSNHNKHCEINHVKKILSKR